MASSSPGASGMEATISAPATSRPLAPNRRWAWSHSTRPWPVPARSVTGHRPVLERRLLALLLAQEEPEEPPRREGQQVRELADLREARAAEHLLGPAPLPGGEVELD